MKTRISHDISANDVYESLLHADITDLERQIDSNSDAIDLWVSIYNISLAVKQNEIINKSGPY